MIADNLTETIVSLVRCKQYKLTAVKESLAQLFKPWGGIGYFVAPGQSILIKPNLLTAARPEEAVTTHPVVIMALAELIRETGGKVIIGDSPGNSREEDVYRLTGIQAVAEATGASLVKFDQASKKEYIGLKRRTLELTTVLDQVDVVINVAKLKTHPLTGLTAAVKNSYGCVVGKKKAKMHTEHPLLIDFAKLVVDIHMAVKPTLSIIDAVISMEGTGPRSGKPKMTELLMASQNAFALDSIAARVVGIKPEMVTTCLVAREETYGVMNLSDIKLEGLTLEESRVKNFDAGVAAGGNLMRLLTNFPLSWVKRLFEKDRLYPHINRELCNGCGNCEEGCPVQIISFHGAIPEIAQEKCIRCYCCREFCPRGAIILGGKVN